jgi:hypothetical protein
MLAELPDHLTELCNNFFKQIPNMKKKFKEHQTYIQKNLTAVKGKN